MATPTKSTTTLKAITNVAASAQSISDVLDVSGKFETTVFIDISPQATNVPGTQIRIEASQAASGNDTWVPVSEFLSTADGVNSHAVDGTEAIGQTVIEESTTTGLARNQYVFFKNGTVGNSEWARVVSTVTSTSFTIQDGLTNAQTGATWYNMAERFVANVPAAFLRLRVVLNNNYGASAVIVNWRCTATTLDSIG